MERGEPGGHDSAARFPLDAQLAAERRPAGSRGPPAGVALGSHPPVAQAAPAHGTRRDRPPHSLSGRACCRALYDDWLLAETQASLELAAWYAAARGDKAAAHARYAARTAAEAAATRLAQRVGRAA
jgi:hypothetical protein